jgi:undecaprenyl-diphosphatase
MSVIQPGRPAVQPTPTGALLARVLALVVAWAACLAAGCVAGYFVVGPSGRGASGSVDRSIARFLAAHRPWGAAGASEILPEAILVVLAVTVAVLVLRRIRAHRGGVGTLLVTYGVSLVGAYGLTSTIKGIFTRPRPPSSLAAISDTGYSFPSSHSTVGVALVVTSLLVVNELAGGSARRFVRGVAIVLVVALPASRLALGVHWTSDVVIGALLGAAWATLSHPLCTRPLSGADQPLEDDVARPARATR